jgi:hypothetical protein
MALGWMPLPAPLWLTPHELDVAGLSEVPSRGRRPSRRTDRQIGASSEYCRRERTAGVEELERLTRTEQLRVAARLTRRARRAMLRVLQMTEKVVVLEGGRQNHQTVQRCRNGPEYSPPTNGSQEEHLFSMIRPLGCSHNRS